MNNFFIFFLFIFNLTACAGGSEKKHFICDYKNSEKTDLDESFDGKFSYFDKIFYYKEKNNGEYAFDFSMPKAVSLGAGFDGDILFHAYLTTKGKQSGFYREIFDVYRFEMKTNTLIVSYVYYVSPEDYNKHFNNPNYVPYNNPSLFDLVNREAPEKYVKIGWDKDKWKCYEISPFQYLIFYLKGFLNLFTA